MALTTDIRIAEELDISLSYLYSLKKDGVFEIGTDNGVLLWDTSIIDTVRVYLGKNDYSQSSDLAPRKTKINNRRYLGNKYRLLPFIREVVDQNCPDVSIVADIFAGTGAVASAFLDRQIITNDTMYSNYICHIAWFSSDKYDEKKIEKYIQYYNSLDIKEDNYMSINFADTYFSASDCRKIGFIREHIETEFIKKKINERERAILITALLYGMDKIANTCGHYDAYRKGSTFDKSLVLSIPAPDTDNNSANQFYNEDANELVKRIEPDLVYIDPPYNSRQYCDAYHLMENVARWEKPKVFGVAKKMDRSNLKSRYCTLEAAVAFEELVSNIHAKYILLSYNNMAEKGNGRSNAKISDDDIFRILRAKGEVTVFSTEYKAFTTGKSDIKDNEERLFLCKCYENKPKGIIPSPLNYTGGKYKLLPQILPLFPRIDGTFVDLFCGGCNVGINVECSKVIFNDTNTNIHYLYNTFRNLDKSELFRFIDEIIDKYGLSRSNVNGYEYYDCESSKGLGSFNKERFLRLREDFNERTNPDYYYYVMLYVIIVYSFNNQIRFNKDGKFNLPVGKRDFNDKMKQKLSDFVDRIKEGNYIFSCKDFREIDVEQFGEDDFIYADPPYLITCATYNEQDGWNETLEEALYDYLDNANKHNIRFALSNVLSSEGKNNEILLSWINRNKYKVIHLNYGYSNSNYHKKDRNTGSDEILVINY